MMISNRTKLVVSFFLISTLFSISTNAANFAITNNCPYTVWAAAAPGGGQQLDNSETWTITAPPGTTGGRIWARTGCSVTGPNGLTCQTGDCGGLLQCEGYGQAPNTLAEYGLDQFDNLDFFDMSLVAGFNVPMQFVPVSNGCTSGPICSVDINAQCPSVLQAPGGCNNPCTVFNTDEYCCNSGSCSPTSYSELFKGLCPDAYSYPQDDPTSTYTCQTGADYNVVFCP